MPTTLSLELALVLLLAAIIAVPLFRKLGLVAVLAYLATGVLLGPAAIGFVSHLVGLPIAFALLAALLALLPLLAHRVVARPA